MTQGHEADTIPSTKGSTSSSGGNSNIHHNHNHNLTGERQSNGGREGMPSDETAGIRDVWASNMEEEFRVIRDVVMTYPCVAMDTEFPGVVARPIGEFKSNCDFQYHSLKCNVDLLKIIQIGLTFMDEQGRPRPGISTWQFNFKFSLQDDMYAEDSIGLLKTSGIQFDIHEKNGIDPFEFAELLMMSGIVLSKRVKFLSFHSGYDFGYLLKILTNYNLPSDEAVFFEILKDYFPVIYDVKYLMKSCKDLKGGLQEVADQLELVRIGPQHQAGSDSLLTGAAFFRMRELFFEENIDDAKYCGHLYGLGSNFVNGTNGVIEDAAASVTNNNINTTTSAANGSLSNNNQSSSTSNSLSSSSASSTTSSATITTNSTIVDVNSK